MEKNQEQTPGVQEEIPGVLEQKPEVKNPAMLLAQRLQENRKSLHIARVPDKTKEAFIALADSEFCGDYGMALKWLMDDIPSQDTRLIIAQLSDHESRIQNLELANHPSEENPSTDIKQIKMLNGNLKNLKKEVK